MIRIRGSIRRHLVALALAMGVAAAIVAIVRERNAADEPLSAPASVPSRTGETPGGAAPVRGGPIGETPHPAIRTDEDAAAALAKFDLEFQSSSAEEWDLLAAAQLPDIVRRDPGLAARLLELEFSAKRRDVLIRHLSRVWGEVDVEGALAWAQALPDAHERAVARRAICLAQSRTDPAAAVRNCANDAEAAAELQGVFQTWAASDVASAGEWLAAQPANAGTEKLRLRYVQVLSRTDPREALRIAQENFAGDPDRDEAMIAVVHQWAIREPRAAWDWATNQAPDHLRSRVFAEIEGLEDYVAGR